MWLVSFASGTGSIAVLMMWIIYFINSLIMFVRLMLRQKEADENIPMDMNEMDAILKWKESGFSMPTAHRISSTYANRN